MKVISIRFGLGQEDVMLATLVIGLELMDHIRTEQEVDEYFMRIQEKP